ncbi:uncharacterized protein K460DRAFT_165491 [Cucurbitaria berberidis CBS 394.84]|uniref:Uncharacterized protein n=1 Tax=Cucurbitaria berberidis CBS 394.84 TaxID=1168544 RepID=A0A9P4L4C7_9PLEO|nr:uncharacterized protein K460DRAFT_165491 [Cucurbitaria berberidis CBS 394.84]KAF1841340.1 hypothetical protein K460DRAFT_165491 [Cucurbitaria berberidis CBS 394.84]
MHLGVSQLLRPRVLGDCSVSLEARPTWYLRLAHHLNRRIITQHLGFLPVANGLSWASCKARFTGQLSRMITGLCLVSWLSPRLITLFFFVFSTRFL